MELKRLAIVGTLASAIATPAFAATPRQGGTDEAARGAFMGSRPPAAEAKGPPRQHHPARPQGPIGLGYTLYRADSSGNPVRVDPAEHFHQGDRVRLVFEPSSDGYLYVFNSTNGGEARLVYPDARLQGGDNRVRAHVLYQLPSTAEADERLRWFVFYGTAGTERLYIVVTRTPLKGIPTGEQLV